MRNKYIFNRSWYSRSVAACFHLFLFIGFFGQSIASQHITHIKGIKDQYDLYLIDINGVVHNNVTPFEEAINTINKLQEEKTVIFLSNMPRPGLLAQKKLIAMGLNKNTIVFTSGDAARLDLVGKLASKKIYHLGAERNQDILEGLEVNCVDKIKDADFILLTQFIEENEDIDQFNKDFKEIVQRNIPVLCANPDLIALHGTKICYCAGTFAKKLESMGAHVDYYGKPDPQIYKMLIEKYSNETISKNKILMIGDTLETDVKGAHSFGIDALLVLTGNTASDIKSSGKSTKAYLEDYYHSYHIQPTYYIEELKW